MEGKAFVSLITDVLEDADIATIKFLVKVGICSQYKKKCKFLMNCCFLCGGGREGGVEIIDCKNDSISVALPFNKELYNRVFLVVRTSHSDFGVKI